MTATETPLEFTKEILCGTCGVKFNALHMRRPDDPRKLMFAQKHCERCVAELKERMEKGAADDAKKRESEKRRASWEAACPAEYRLIEDGGSTDLARLYRDRSQARLIIEKHVLCAQGVLIRGESGVCKTRTMYALLRRFHFDSLNPIRTVAVTGGRFERDARSAAGSHKLDAWFDSLASADVMFIDDIGKAPWSDNTASIFFDLVEERTNHRRPLFITTNLDGDGLVKRLGLGPDMGNPLLRRIRENLSAYVFRSPPKA